MIVNTHGKCIHSAFLEYTNLGKLLIINTIEKGLHPHTIISGYIDKDKYGVRFEYKYRAFVELLSETQEEENFLSTSMRFENHCKDQKHVLFIPVEYLYSHLEENRL